jgi:hypothetical protein
MRDPYDVLGVARSASAAELKAVFRKLVRKLHPDTIKHDPGAASRIAEINAAYEILGDKDKRKAFDSGEIDAEGKPRFQGFDGRGGARTTLDADFPSFEEPGRVSPPAPTEVTDDSQGGQPVRGEVGEGQVPRSTDNVGTNEDVIDPEFTEVDGHSTQFKSQQFRAATPGPTPNKSSPWRKVLLACGGAVFVYAIYVHRSQEVTPPTIPGWDKLIPCSHAVSIDGSKELLLSEEHIATLYDKSLAKDGKSNENIGVLGAWSFDDQSKKYFVSLAGTTNAYTLLSPEQVSTCILIKGNLESADLQESWFSAEEDDPGDYDSNPGDR